MAMTNTLMMVQAGFPTGVCVVRSRKTITEKAEMDVGVWHMKTAPRGRTPEPRFFQGMLVMRCTDCWKTYRMYNVVL